MKFLSFIRNMVIGIGFVVAGASFATAAIVSNSDTQMHQPFGFLFSDDINGFPPFVDSQSLGGSYTLQQFNGALGTLNSVRIEFNQTVNSQIDDTGGTCALGFSECAVNLARSFTQSGAVTLGSASGTAASIIDADNVNCDLGVGPTACHSAPYPHALASPYGEAIDLTSAADVANFVGGGTFTVTTDLIAEYAASRTIETLELSSGVSFTWGGTATVIYDYTPGGVVAMPAPAGAAFLLIGLAALARSRRG